MTFRTQHVPGPRAVQRGRCRDYPWSIIDPEIGEIGRMISHADAIRAARSCDLLAALGTALGLITKHGLGVKLAEDEEHALDFARLKKARAINELTMADLSGGKDESEY